jgi:hypothetical protein
MAEISKFNEIGFDYKSSWTKLDQVKIAECYRSKEKRNETNSSFFINVEERSEMYNDSRKKLTDLVSLVNRLSELD